LAHLAERAARDAAAVLGDRWTDLRHQVATKSTSTDAVTAADQLAEARIVDRLLSARPDDAILAEEGGAVAGRSGVRWVIDPLDGTVNYLYGIPAFCVSIAAELDGIVVAGVVVDAAHGEVYRAVRGGGASCDGERLAVSAVVDTAQALVATGFGYDPARRAAQAAVVAALLPRVRDIRRLGSAALDLCHVARGRTDAYYEYGLNPWDYAAGTLIAAEAGAIATDFDGAAPSPDGCLVCGPALHGSLLDLLVASGIRGPRP
jgi:myo-inositol-1(or 4)-monophosphatase